MYKKGKILKRRFYVVYKDGRYFVHDQDYPSTYLWCDSKEEAIELADLLEDSKGEFEVDEFFKIIDENEL